MIRSIILASALIGAGMAEAGTFGFTLDLGMADANAPIVTLINDSDSELLTGGVLTLGNTAFNFDCIGTFTAPAGGTLSFSTPEVGTCFPGGGQRPDAIVFTATGFDPGESLSFQTDIDPDFSDGTVSNPDVLLSGGSFVASFEGGGTLSASLVSGQYSYSATSAATVPLPASAVLLVAGLGALGVARRRPSA